MRLTILICATLILLAPTKLVAGSGRVPPLLVYVKPHYSKGDPEATGLFRIRLDLKSGRVSDVSVARSTGYPQLDRAALAAIRYWRFHPETSDEFVFPITFSQTRPKGNFRKIEHQ